MQTPPTGLRCIPRRNLHHLHSRPDRFVADHPLQLGKTPFVRAFRFARLTNPLEVFKDDSLVVRSRLSHDLFANAVIGVRDETSLSTRDTLERSFGALAAVGL